MAAVMLQVIPIFFIIFSKNRLFISVNTYKKYLASEEYCIARHDDKMCSLPNCRYHIILIGNIKEWLQKLDAFCFNHNTWNVCIHFSNTASVTKQFSRVDNSLIICRGQFILINKTEESAESSKNIC